MGVGFSFVKEGRRARARAQKKNNSNQSVARATYCRRKSSTFIFIQITKNDFFSWKYVFPGAVSFPLQSHWLCTLAHLCCVCTVSDTWNAQDFFSVSVLMGALKQPYVTLICIHQRLENRTHLLYHPPDTDSRWTREQPLCVNNTRRRHAAAIHLLAEEQKEARGTATRRIPQTADQHSVAGATFGRCCWTVPPGQNKKSQNQVAAD